MVTALESRRKEDLTVQVVNEKLLQEYQRRI